MLVWKTEGKAHVAQVKKEITEGLLPLPFSVLRSTFQVSASANCSLGGRNSKLDHAVRKPDGKVEKRKIKRRSDMCEVVMIQQRHLDSMRQTDLHYYSHKLLGLKSSNLSMNE
jgi:hypothetical protein